MAVRRMSRPSRFAVAAAKLALEHAGVEVPAEPDPSFGVTLSTAFGPSAYTQRLLDILRRPFGELYDFDAPWSVSRLRRICDEAGMPMPGPDEV